LFISAVESFKPSALSNVIVTRLLQLNIYRQIKEKNKDREFVYKQGRPADYFVLILEGRVEVSIGQENMKFDSGPFSYFGVNALPQLPPDAEGTSRSK